jgi:phosphatidate cytidylyltransferase
MGSVVTLLLVFTIIWRIMEAKQSSMAQEIKDRTITWWWMVAVFMVAMSTHRIVSFIFLGFLCFSSLREYFSMMPMCETHHAKTLSFHDRASVSLSFLAIPVTMWVAYIAWYELFIIIVPVYLILLIPIVFVIQDRAEGSIKSLGIIYLGLMLFVYNLGHCLFMINIGPMLLMFCFILTEVRDVLSFWTGKAFAGIATRIGDGLTKSILELKIAKRVSPQKTWVAGLVAAFMVSALALVFVPIIPPFEQGSLSYPYASFVGFLIGILGLFGDLVFSMIKRDMGMKDTGNLLPGHGGIIDRVDSLVFTIPITFHLIYWMYF